MTKNPGRCPPEATGKRVRGVLRNGWQFGFARATSDEPGGERAELMNWTLTGGAGDIISWEPAA